MKNLARMKWVLFSVALGAGGGAALMEGCASDDTIVHPPPPDGSVDGSRPDGNGTDAGTDASDANILDSQTHFDVGPPQLGTYVDQVTRLYCEKVATCCGDSFDVENCVRNYKLVPNPGAVFNDPDLPYLDGGHMKLVADKAQSCFDQINKLSCGATAGSLKTLYDTCVAGAVGTIPTGASGCKGSPECVPNDHCELEGGAPADGGAIGTCVPPRALNESCPLGNWSADNGLRPGTPGYFYESQAQCGYLVTGNPYYCANYDTNEGFEADGGNYPKCRPQVPVGANCYTHTECATLYCDGIVTLPDGTVNAGTCSDNPLIGVKAICDANTKADAGSDGGSARSQLPPEVRAQVQEQGAPPLHKVHHPELQQH